MKNLLIDEGDGEEKQKIVDIIDEKIFQSELRQRRKNRDWWKEEGFVRRGTCLKRNLFKKGFG